MYEMYRLMAIAKYDERYVIPTAHVEQAHELEEIGCSLDFDEGPGMYESGPFGEAQRPAGAGRRRDLPRAQAAADLRRAAPAPIDLRGRVNLLNWDGNGTPRRAVPGASTDGGARRDGHAARRSDRGSCTRSRRWCLAYPDDELLDRLPAARARPLAEQPDCARARRLGAFLVGHLGSHAARRTCSAPTSTCSTSSRKHALYLSYWTDGDTRRRGEVLGAVQERVPRQRLPRRHPRRAARLPADGARVRRRRRPGGGRGAAAGVPAEPRAAPARAARGASTPYAGVRSCAVCATLPGASPADRRRGAWRWPRPGPPTESVGLEPTTRGCSRCSRSTESALMDVLLWGVLPYLMLVVLVGGHDLALPLRQVRLDDPLVAALRVAAAADRLAAVPLRHPAGRVVGHIGGLVIPESWTEAVGICEGLYHVNALLFGGIAGRLHPRRDRSSSSTGGARPGRSSWRPPATTRRCTSLLVGAIVLGLWTTLVSVGAGHEAHNYRETVSPWFRSLFVLQPDVDAMAAAPRPVPGPHAGRDAAVRDLAVHPAGARLHRAAALPVPPLHRLPQPGRAPTPGARPPAPRLEPGRHPRPRQR